MNMNRMGSRQARTIDHAGQSLFEVVIALAVVGLTAIGIVKVTSASVRNARYAAEQTGAVALAEQKIAELKVKAINDSTNFWNLPSTADTGPDGQYCYLIDVANDKANLPTEAPNYLNAGLAKVTISIFWEINDVNSGCGDVGTGKSNYRRFLEFTTLIAK